MTTLQQMIEAQNNAHVVFNEVAESLSAAGIYSKNHDTTSALTWGYYGGRYNGNTVANGTLSLTDNSDNYVVILRSTGAASVSTATTHSTDPLYARIYKVTTLSGEVTAVLDERWETNGLLFAPGTVGTPGDMVLASVQTVTGAKTFGSAGAVGRLKVAGTTSGAAIIDAPAVAGSIVLTLPATTGTLVHAADVAAAYQPLDADLTALAALTSASNKIPRFTGSGTAGLLDFSTDTTLTGNSDTTISSQKALKTYIDAIVTGGASDVMIFKGVLDCSANPNYPAADAGNLYKVSVAGKIGGGAGPNVEIGDTLYCITDSTSSGTHAGVGANWVIAQVNIDNAYFAGGTDVAVADGGTGASTASGARTNLGLVIGADVAAYAATVSALATSGTVNIDCSLGDYFTIALAGAVTSITFSNLPGSGKGASKWIQFTQDSTPRAVTWPGSFKWAGGVAGTVSTGSGAIDELAITTVDNGTTWKATLGKAFA